MSKIKMHDLVALRDPVKAKHFDSGVDLLLPEGLVGTVVEEYEKGKAYEVEFSDNHGQTYAMLTLKVEKLFQVHFNLPNLAAVQ